MSEKEIENYLVRKIKNKKGTAYKFTSPGNSGVPDRICMLPNGKIFFVELKSPGKKPRALQVNQIRKITNLGQRVYVVDSKEMVDRVLENELLSWKED
ncbi:MULTISPECIES: VRR-NUC domain-containing protein [Leptotrichia]|uniref:VRR-NUC domain-containing protein n=1 Tax=Leptotrichia TaxID=32067 RepID=UPI0015BBF544|nr:MULTISPECIES: VRR-NUC domain-containing protein [Leptotrichia]NWO20170.1 VRR-NUC domain-containing protein [Leptotrichia sp. oral taxon 223]